MFKKSKDKEQRVTQIDSLVGQGTELAGDIKFSGGLHIDGIVKGNITATDANDSVLTLSERGVIEGEIRVPKVTLNGTVKGDVYASEQIELAPQARITGNVYYKLIEMANGAEVNGNLVRQQPGKSQPGASVSSAPADTSED